MFDFSKALKESKASLNNTNLAAVVLGPSGAGKSFLCGTMGVKTLYLYVSGESHGPISAGIEGGANLDPYCLDYYDGKPLNADQTYDHLLHVLNSPEIFKTGGYKAVVVDGASEIEAIIKETSKHKKGSINHNGKSDPFLGIDVTKAMFRTITSALKNLQRTLGIHYVVTCILDVKELNDNGEIMESSPRLNGYGVAEALVQHFDDVVVVGRVANDDEVGHKIQFNAKVVKVSKTAAGAIKKAVNYSPRLGGVSVDLLPGTMDASLAEVIKLKRKNT